MIKFIAKCLDEKTLTESDYNSPSLLPLKQIKEIKIFNDNHSITIKPNIDKGETINYFKRNCLSITNSSLITLHVYEIKNENNIISRVYWHPIEGPILSTDDLRFT